MQEITNVSTEILRVHPRNTEFFDDINGEEYDRFKLSIQNDGILSPILVSPDMMVISGHQRLKASKDLGIKLVPVMIREDLIEEDDKLKILLAANFGRTKNDESKQRKVAVEYVNLCGLKHGDTKTQRSSIVDNRLSLSEIAKQLGTSETSLKELLLIERKLTPEIKELIDNGTITKTTASKVLTKLSPSEQEDLITTYGKDIIQGATQKQVQEYIDKLKEKDNVIAGYEMKLKSTSSEQTKKYQEQLETLKTQISIRDNKISTYENQKEMLEKKAALNNEEAEKYKKLKSDIEFLSKQKNDISRQITSATELAGLTVSLQSLLEKDLAPIKFKRCMEVLDTSDIAVQNLNSVLNSLNNWISEINQYLPNANVITIEKYNEI